MNCGWRVYFVRVRDKIILLVGGHKNEQEKTLKKQKLSLADLPSINIKEGDLKKLKEVLPEEFFKDSEGRGCASAEPYGK